MPIEYDPTLPGVHANPYEHYARLQVENPAHWSTAAQAWVFTRYRDVLAALRDQRLSSAGKLRLAADALPAEERQRLSTVFHTMTMTPTYLDQPEHTRMRRLVNAAFRQRQIQRVRPRVEGIVDQLLQPGLDRGSMDIVRDFAHPLPVMVSAALLGVPPEDAPRLLAWADDFSRLTEFDLRAQTVAQERAERAIREMIAYFRVQVAARRQDPGADGISAIIAAADEEAPDDEPLAIACLTVVLAGHLNVRYLIGLGMLTLLSQPETLALIRSHPELLPPVIDELCRYDGIGQHLTRVAAEDVTLAGCPVRRGERVLLLLAAANRDPEQFQEPEKLCPGRAEGRAIPFGAGIHLCPGASLTRLIAEVAFDRLLNRLPGVRLADTTPRWIEDTVARGLSALPVLFEAAAATAQRV